MKLIIHGVSNKPGEGWHILAMRAGLSVARGDAKPGQVRLIEFEDGSIFEVHRNKHSVSVWVSCQRTKETGRSQSA